MKRIADSRLLPAQMTLTVLILRVGLFLVVWMALRSIPTEWTATGSRMLHAWSMWDGGHYAAIATHGYSAQTTGQDLTAFFPLYPMLMRIVSDTTGLSVQVSGLMISLVSLLGTVWLLTGYLQRKFGDDIARESILVFAVTPYAVFLTAIYTESLFMLLAIATLTFADRRMWWGAVFTCALATATRITGLALVATLLWLLWRNRESISRIVIYGAGSVLGIVTYMVWLWQERGSPFEMLTAQVDWGGWYDRFGKFIEVFVTRPSEIVSGDHIYPIALVNLGLLVLSLATIPWMWKRLDHGLALYSTLVVSQGAIAIMSFGRMMIHAFGVHIVVAIWLQGSGWKLTIRQVALLGSVMCSTLFAILFAYEKWII